MHIVHLTSSTFYGGPERQMLGLAQHLPPRLVSSFLSYPEQGRCSPFLAEARKRGYNALPLAFDFPRMKDCLRELEYLLRTRAADVLVTHTYKPNILGRIVAKRLGIPHVVVSRGWTGETLKVKAYEAADRLNLRYADHVVCVSEGQARKVRRLKLDPNRLSVIANAARPEAFANGHPDARGQLLSYFPRDSGVTQVVLAAGRLSPEKGFPVLVEAMNRVCQMSPHVGCIVFGEGKERAKLEKQIQNHQLQQRFQLPGFTATLDSLYGGADVVVLPSLTEGLPNVALEASAAGVPIVATAVGGTPEVVKDGVTGFLVPSGQPFAMADSILKVLQDCELAKSLGDAGRKRMEDQFTFPAQSQRYAQLFDSLLPARRLAA